MDLQYAVIYRSDAWRLLRGGAEMAAFDDLDLATRIARTMAYAMAAAGNTVELLVQDRFGELVTEPVFGMSTPVPTAPRELADTALGAPSVH